MKTLKTVLKLISGLLVGVVVGLSISAIGIVRFTDITLSEFIGRLGDMALGEAGLAVLTGMCAFLVSLFVIIILHEAGHLVAGLLSGYKFVPFRVFGYVFIKEDGKLRVKKFGVAGTGGQCLLVPPEKPDDEIPTFLYNAGGIMVQILLLLTALPFMWIADSPFMKECIAIFLLFDVLLLLVNAIPAKMGGIGNDGYNMLYLHKNPLSKHSFVLQLRTNALIQSGVRSKDMPSGWFVWKEDIDWENALEVAIPLMFASREIDKGNFEEAYGLFDKLYSRKDKIMGLYVNEIACELAFCAMATNRIDRAKGLLDDKLLKYIDGYKEVMSSKQRILFAKALLVDSDIKKAHEIYESLEARQDEYLLKGEVESDLDIMRRISTVPDDVPN